MRTKKTYLDILRILAITMVFHFHFVIILENKGFLFGFANGDWGCVGTSLFFLISGNCLARNYGKKLDVKGFYIKRWLAIFPAFYLCYVLGLLVYIVLLRVNVWAGLEPWRAIFTLLGVDNYMNFLGVRNGALVGEWYTAIILVIYLLFPLLQFLYRKSKVLGTVLVFGLYVLNLIFVWGKVPDDAHPLTGMALFWLGMLIYHFEEKLEKMPPLILALILGIAVCLLIVPLPGVQLVLKNAMAICIFLIFMRTEPLLEGKKLPGVIGFLSRIEYGIYLCHHIAMYVLRHLFLIFLGGINPILYYVACLVGTLVAAVILMQLSGFIVDRTKRLIKK